jgi:hypothetical protein
MTYNDQSLEYIRNQYKVPAYKGVKVIAYGKPGVITGASGAYLKIKLDHESISAPYHPTDGMDYLIENKEQTS